MRIRDLLPEGKMLIEPFVGSGAVFLNTDYPAYLLADINGDLINTYVALQTHGAKFIVDAKTFFSKTNNTETAYYRLREQFNTSRDPYERAIIFLYLNRHCYNGLCRYNQAGEFNVPFGRYAAPYFPEYELHCFFVKLKRATIVRQHFVKSLRRAKKSHVVYCDPPYFPLSDTANFTSFSAAGFTIEDQQLLAREAERAMRHGAYVLISNHDTRMARTVYSHAQLRSTTARRRISCNPRGRAPVAELFAIFDPSVKRARSQVQG